MLHLPYIGWKVVIWLFARRNALQCILLPMSSSLRWERALHGSVPYRHDLGYQEILVFLRMQVRFFAGLWQIRFPDKA